MKTVEIIQMKVKGIIQPKLLHRHDNFAKALIEYHKQYADQYALYEGLVLTQPRGISIDAIKRTFPKSINFSYEKETNDFRIMLHQNRQIDAPKLFQLINNLGWFVNEIELDGQPYKGNDKKANQNLIQFKFKEAWLNVQAKYDIEVEVPRLLYHATPTNRVNKILKIGLSPRTQSTLAFHPERVYFTSTIEGAGGLLPHLGREKRVELWTILEIDTRRIPSVGTVGTTNYFRLFRDPSYPHIGRHVGFYTLNNIPPAAVRAIRNITISYKSTVKTKNE